MERAISLTTVGREETTGRVIERELRLPPGFEKAEVASQIVGHQPVRVLRLVVRIGLDGTGPGCAGNPIAVCELGRAECGSLDSRERSHIGGEFVVVLILLVSIANNRDRGSGTSRLCFSPCRRLLILG